jgi:hypothetical protein
MMISSDGGLFAERGDLLLQRRAIHLEQPGQAQVRHFTPGEKPPRSAPASHFFVSAAKELRQQLIHLFFNNRKVPGPLSRLFQLDILFAGRPHGVKEQGAEGKHVPFRAGGEGKNCRRGTLSQDYGGRPEPSQADQARQRNPGIDVSAGRIEIESSPTPGLELEQFFDQVRLLLGEVPRDGHFPALAAVNWLGVMLKDGSMRVGMWFHV